VKLLAELTGHPLKIMTVSPEMDTIELLGGFEQVRFMFHLSSHLPFPAVLLKIESGSLKKASFVLWENFAHQF